MTSVPICTDTKLYTLPLMYYKKDKRYAYVVTRAVRHGTFKKWRLTFVCFHVYLTDGARIDIIKNVYCYCF